MFVTEPWTVSSSVAYVVGSRTYVCEPTMAYDTT
jgi:hypothetical protein